MLHSVTIRIVTLSVILTESLKLYQIYILKDTIYPYIGMCYTSFTNISERLFVILKSI